MKRHTYWLTLAAIALLSACSSDDTTTNHDTDGGTLDSAADSASDASSDSALQDSATDTETDVTDGSTQDTGVDATDGSTQDTGVDAADSSTDTGVNDSSTTDAGPYGFTIRKPASDVLKCKTTTGGEQDFDDVDWICTFPDKNVEGYVYLQFSPDNCITTGFRPMADYKSVLAQISIDGHIEPLTGATYDWGGNHHNDSLTFQYQGIGYRYYHSSFGYGWRKCQPMDCAQLSDPASGPVTTDGCTADRTVPIVCRQIKSDGTYDDLVDTFAKCPGDPNGS